MTPHVPWLLTAPPWEPDDRGPETPTQGPASRKRTADAIATSAETQLGKLAHAFASVARKKGWRHLITATRGVSNLSETALSSDHRASRLLQHLRNGERPCRSLLPRGRGVSAMLPSPKARILPPTASVSLCARKCSILSTRATGSRFPTAKLAAGPRTSASPRWALSRSATDDHD